MEILLHFFDTLMGSLMEFCILRSTRQYLPFTLSRATTLTTSSRWCRCPCPTSSPTGEITAAGPGTRSWSVSRALHTPGWGRTAGQSQTRTGNIILTSDSGNTLRSSLELELSTCTTTSGPSQTTGPCRPTPSCTT